MCAGVDVSRESMGEGGHGERVDLADGGGEGMGGAWCCKDVL